MPGELITAVTPQDLTLLAESGMMTTEVQQQLAVATTGIAAMKNASSPVGGRHFARLDSIISVKFPSPVNQARDVLNDLDAVWSNASDEFHRYRQMAFDVKLRRAKLNIQRKKKSDDEDEQIVNDAECELEQAKIDALEAQLANGKGKLTDTINKATHQSEKYKLLCKKAGVESFTEADFLKEEVEYLVRTAWWHAGQGFSTVDTRGDDLRRKDKPRDKMSHKEQVAHDAKIRRESFAVRVPMDVGIYFEALGITKQEVRTELAAIDEQRRLYSQMYGSHEHPPTFADSGYMESWLQQMVTKYSARVMTNLKEHGPDRLKRLQSIISPTNDDKGGGTGSTIERKSIFEA